MIRKLLQKFYRIFIMRIYTNDEVLLLELKHRHTVTSPATISKVTEENIVDARYFQTEAQVREFKQFLNQGHKGYYAYMRGYCIHRSWVVPGPHSVSLHKFYKMPLKENEVFIQFCETASEVRGKNIFTHALATIGKDFQDSRVLISVDSKNFSSVKSMFKAGFVEVSRVRIKVVFGIKKTQEVTV